MRWHLTVRRGYTLRLCNTPNLNASRIQCESADTPVASNANLRTDSLWTWRAIIVGTLVWIKFVSPDPGQRVGLLLCEQHKFECPFGVRNGLSRARVLASAFTGSGHSPQAPQWTGFRQKRSFPRDSDSRSGAFQSSMKSPMPSGRQRKRKRRQYRRRPQAR